MRDLRDQNAVLMETVEELEKEANERVTLVEDKLLKTRSLAKVFPFLLQFCCYHMCWIIVRFIPFSHM